MAEKEQWKNRIEGSGLEDPKNLLPNPANWRTHSDRQKHTLNAVMQEIGWVQQVIVNKGTGNLIDGHLRVATAIENEESEIPVLYVDLTPEEESLVLTTLDPLSGMAGADPDALEDILASLETENLSINALIEDLATSTGIGLAAEEDDRIAGSQSVKEITIQYSLVFDDEDQQKDWYDFLSYLRAKYPAKAHVADRISAYVEDLGVRGHSGRTKDS